MEHQTSVSGNGSRLRILPLLFLGIFLALPAVAMILNLIDVKRDGAGIVELLGGASAVAVSGDGNHIFVTAADDNAITVFFRDASVGSMTYLEDFEDEHGGVFGMLGATGVTASPDNRHVYVTSFADDTLVVFSRDVSNETLSFIAAEVKENNVGGVIGLDGARAVTVSHDDTQVFAVGGVDDALVIFSRDATTDELTFVEAELNDLGGVSGLDGASAVAVSPDDQYVYVTAEIDDSLVVFERLGDGTVSFVTRYQDDVDGVDGLNGAAGVGISADGNHLYVAGRVDCSVATFERDPATGLLTFLAVDRDGIDGIDGLDGAMGLAVSPDGSRVFVASRYDNAVAAFRRTPTTGALEFLDVLIDGVYGVDGLAGAVSLAVSPDSRHVYVASYDENAVAAIRIGLCMGDVTAGDDDGDAICDDLDVCLGDDFIGDGDGDGVCDDLDLCPGSDDNLDDDSDGVPDGCDLCFGDDAAGDTDSDGVCDDADICMGHDASGDSDADGVCADLDCNDGHAAVTHDVIELISEVIDNPLEVVACTSIIVGPGVVLDAGADLVLRAGSGVDFGSFSVATGAKMSVLIQPELAGP